MKGRKITAAREFLGAFLTAMIAWGCNSAGTSSVSPSAEGDATASHEEELGEAFASCVDADSTAWTDGVLTIDATASTTGIIIVSPGNSVVKVNGRICTAGGAKIPLTSVQNIVVNGRAGVADTFVLDFSAGLPKAPLLQDGGIVVNGNEAIATTKTPDTVVIKGSSGSDVVTVGLDADPSEGQVDVALTASSKVPHVALKNLGRAAPSPFSPSLIFSLGAGDDNFNGLGDFPDASPSTPVNHRMAIYGGAGNDTVVGGVGGDKIDGGGQATDTVNYTDRATTPVFVDTGTSSVTVWGGDLRGVTLAAGGKLYVDRGNGSLTAITFAGEATPSAIVVAINSGLGAQVASIVGNRLRLTSTGSRIIVNSLYSDDTAAKLGLQNGLYEVVGNDGAPGGQLATPWRTPPTLAASATAYAVGDVVVPIAANGYWYKATVAGTSAGGDPSFSTTLGATVVDGGVTWTTGGRVWKAAIKWAPGDVIYDVAYSAVYEIMKCTGKTGALTTLGGSVGATTTDGGVTWTTAGQTWQAATAYTSGDYAVKTAANGYYYKATSTGTSAASEPTWPTVVGRKVVDGGVTWVCMGPASVLAGAHQYALGDFVRDASGVLGTMTDSAMLSANSAPSMGPTRVDVADGDVYWTYKGTLAENDDVQGVSIINGGDGDDVLVGSSGANTLNGNAGNDVLMGGPLVVPSASCPVDKLNGGEGDDWFDMGPDDKASTLTKDDCNQIVTGGSGTDVVDYSQRSANSVLLVKLDGITASGEQSLLPREADKIGSDVEVALGGAGLDLITGSDSTNFLFGGPGADHIYGGKGDDHIYGGAGDDSLYGDLGNDTFYELSAFPASGAWNEPLSGTTFAGVGLAIYGSEKPGAGDDVVFGGTDLTESNKVDFTDAQNPVAVAICSDAAASNGNLKSCTTASSDYVHNGLDGTTATPGASGTQNSYINVEYLAGALQQKNVFIGSANGEVFEGGADVDVILGQGGPDALSGSPDMASGFTSDNVSIDILCGGDSDDTLVGGTNALLEGEGQMDQSHATQGSTAVLLSGTSSQAPSFCKDPSNSVYTVVTGTNVCFGATNKTHCAN
ncbi:MAG: hypothetical protein QM756_09810 [Polyangiaceae bacterium]